MVSDQRIKVMNEVISGMRVIKMYTWEYAFKKMVDKIRKQVIIFLLLCSLNISIAFHRKEIYILTKAAIIHAFSISCYTILNNFTIFIVFTVLVCLSPPLSDSGIGSRQIFTTLGVIAFVRRETVLFYVIQLMKLSDFNVALKRIQVSELKVPHNQQLMNNAAESVVQG